MTELKLTCRDCGSEFAFSDAEQEYFRAQGFAPPKRCLQCRAQNRRAGPRSKPAPRGEDARPDTERGAPSAERRATDTSAPRKIAVRRAVGPPPERVGLHAAGAGDAPSPADENGAAPRPMFAATCSLCSTETQVPFQPDGVRPVFCLPCLKRRTR